MEHAGARVSILQMVNMNLMNSAKRSEGPRLINTCIIYIFFFWLNCLQAFILELIVLLFNGNEWKAMSDVRGSQ